jgi:MFS transporter, CP family, cyanate transporter
VRSTRWLVAIVLVSLNLRPAVASVPPLADTIARQFHLSAAATGLLTTLPVLCMGLFAPIGAIAARRFGAERVLAAAVALIVVGTALRAVPSLAFLYGATAVTGTGIAVAGALLPPLVRARFPDRIGPVTGLYTTGLIGGALLAASLTEPLRAAAHWDWPAALAFWALPALVAFAVWSVVARLRSSGARPAGASSRVAPPWRQRTVWYATIFMGGQSLLYYASLAWLAARYTAVGASPAEAGFLLGLFSATQLVSALGLPALAHRFGDPRPWIAASLGTTGISLALVAAVPNAVPWLWASLLGLGMGGQFALALTVLGGLGATPAESAAASGLAFFVGYLMAAVGPVAAGALRDVTGGYWVPFAALAVFTVPVLVAGVVGGKPSAPTQSNVDAARLDRV